MVLVPNKYIFIFNKYLAATIQTNNLWKFSNVALLSSFYN